MSWPDNRRVAALGLLVLAAVTFFWIPGVGIILGVMAAGVALTPDRNASLVWGIVIALLGILAIPFVDPILGTVVLLFGALIAIAWPRTREGGAEIR